MRVFRIQKLCTTSLGKMKSIPCRRAPSSATSGPWCAEAGVGDLHRQAVLPAERVVDHQRSTVGRWAIPLLGGRIDWTQGAVAAARERAPAPSAGTPHAPLPC